MAKYVDISSVILFLQAQEDPITNPPINPEPTLPIPPLSNSHRPSQYFSCLSQPRARYQTAMGCFMFQSPPELMKLASPKLFTLLWLSDWDPQKAVTAIIIPTCPCPLSPMDGCMLQSDSGEGRIHFSVKEKSQLHRKIYYSHNKGKQKTIKYNHKWRQRVPWGPSRVVWCSSSSVQGVSMACRWHESTRRYSICSSTLKQGVERCSGILHTMKNKSGGSLDIM